MKSPRKLRPHCVIIRHKIGENDDFEAEYEETLLRYVKFDENVSLKQSSKGKEEQSSSVLVIDCFDLYAKKNCIRCRYISCSNYKPCEGIFSIFVNDIIIWNNREYTVTKINEVNPFGKNQTFIEVNCNG